MPEYDYYSYKTIVGKDGSGKDIRKTFYSKKSKADAKKKAEKFKKDQFIAEATGKNMAVSATGFTDWANKWLEIYKKPNVSENTYRLTYESTVNKHLKPFFQNVDLMNIKPADVQEFFITKQGLSESMLDKIHLCLMGIFETAIDNDLCIKNPAKNAIYTSGKDKAVKNVYSDTEIETAKAYFKNIMPEVILILCTGLRRGEMLGLMWKDIDIENKSLTVNRSIADKKGGGIEIRPPKWNSYRTIPLEDDVLNVLNVLKKSGLYVFPIENRPQLPNSWSQKLDRHMENFEKESGIKPLTAHELRHTYGTMLRRRGVDIYTIQKIMGHKDIKMTSEIYVHDEFEVSKRNVLEKLNKNDKAEKQG